MSIKLNRESVKLWLRSSNWVFPIILLLPFLLLVCLKVNGSSIGIYHAQLFGIESNDPDLLYGSPKPIRSDEWLVWSQLTISQSENDFNERNDDLGSGRDVSLHTEIPNKNWSSTFKPQFWSFFILPLEYAYAFKWWSLMYLLIVSCYFFVLHQLPNKKSIAIPFSLAIGLSPFVIWWYQSGIFLLLSLGFLILIQTDNIISGKRMLSKDERIDTILKIATLAFLLSCFGFTLYPPFQIAVGIVVAVYILGTILQKLTSKASVRKKLVKPLIIMFISALVAAALGIIFIVSHSETISAYNNTLYPGSRVIVSGDLKILNVFNSFLMPLLQGDYRGANFIGNQSESSNFILFLPFLLIPGIYLSIHEYVKRKRIDFVFVGLILCSLLFLSRMFLPYGDSFYELLLLHKVPNKRLLIGLGFLGIIFTIQIIRKINDLKFKQKDLMMMVVPYALACLTALMWISYHVEAKYPKFIDGWHEAAILSLTFTIMIMLLLLKRPVLFAVALLCFSAFSTFKVMPLYRGLGEVYDGKLVEKIRQISIDDNDTWITVGDIYYENFGILAGKRSYSGVQIYPDNNFWSENFGKDYEKVYNRKAHAVFVPETSNGEEMELTQTNLFTVNFSCSSFITENVDFVLSTHELDEKCLKLLEVVEYPKRSFSIYEVN